MNGPLRHLVPSRPGRARMCQDVPGLSNLSLADMQGQVEKVQGTRSWSKARGYSSF